MKHFAYYPVVEYSGYAATNLMVRAKIRDAVLKNTALYYKYTVADGERPDIISHKYYGNSSYTWAIFYANNIFDPMLEWVMDYSNFQLFLIDKYGSLEAANNINAPHHYEWYDPLSQQTFVIDETTYNTYLGFFDEEIGAFKEVRKVTNFEYENTLNEARRNIVIIEQQYVYQLVNELINIFDE